MRRADTQPLACWKTCALSSSCRVSCCRCQGHLPISFLLSRPPLTFWMFLIPNVCICTVDSLSSCRSLDRTQTRFHTGACCTSLPRTRLSSFPYSSAQGALSLSVRLSSLTSEFLFPVPCSYRWQFLQSSFDWEIGR